MTTLSGQTILIIGGTSGIGYCIALGSLKSLAARVIVVSSSAQRVSDAAQKLQAGAKAASLPGVVEGVAVDATNLPELDRVIQGAGEIDHLIYTSGSSLKIQEFKETDVASMKDILDLRVWAPIQAAKSAKFKNGQGSIIFTTGSVLNKPGPQWTYVAVSCGAIDAATRGLAVDLAPVRVNIVAPGVVETDLWAGMSEEERAGLYKAVADKLLVKHVASPEEIAEAYLFLMKYVTGETVHVNGGYFLV